MTAASPSSEPGMPPSPSHDRCYLVSSTFHYEKTICSDYGPKYAEHMGWDVAGLAEGREAARSYPVVLVDTRFNEEECRKLTALIDDHPGTLFGLSVIDPGAQDRGTPYPQLLFEVRDRPNVFYLSRYEPEGTAQHLVDLTHRDRLVVIPYAFVPPVYSTEDHAERDSRILFSGSLNIHTYPYRQTFDRLRRYVPTFSRYVDRLSHPGYPDTGSTLGHDIIGDRYIEHLSRYRHVLLTPSKYRIELLKYRECAMAGSVPVGLPPRGLPREMLEPFVEVPLDRPLRAAFSLVSVFNMSSSEAEDRARAYQSAYQEHRNPRRLNEKLDTFLEETVQL